MHPSAMVQNCEPSQCNWQGLPILVTRSPLMKIRTHFTGDFKEGWMCRLCDLRILGAHAAQWTIPGREHGVFESR